MADDATTANGNGIIRTLPVTEDFENGTGIFTGGENFDHTSSLGKILRVYSDADNSAFSKATASFDVDETTKGNQAYVLKSNEKVTISYTAFHGWLSRGKTATFSVLNSEGKAVVSYTYDYNSCNITNLSIGGITVSGFSAFVCQSTRYNDVSKNADGLDKNWYSIKEGYNPQITMTISGNGLVTISFQKSIGSTKVDKTFSASLPDDVANNLGSIVIENASNTNAGRAYAIDNLSIKTETSAETTASYTVKKVCGSQVLSTETGVGVVGTTPTLTGENIFVGDKKYIYVGNDAESIGAISSETVYTLNYREAASYNYSVVGKIGDEMVLNIANGTNFEGETVKVPYLRYILKDGKWYEATKGTAGYYLASAELTQDNQEIDVDYSSKDLANITYFKEAEDIDGLTVSTNQNADVRCSNGAGAYNSSEEPVVVTTLPAGTYKLTIGLWGGKTDQNFKLNCGDEWTVPFTGSFQDVSNEITLDKETTISIPKSDAANGRCLDYVMIQTLGNNVAVSNINYASYVPTCNVVAPADVKVYTATADVNNDVIKLTEIPAGSVIPAGTALLVGAAEGSYTFTASAEAASTIDASNELKAATAGTAGDGSSIYALTEKDGKAVFARVAAGVEVPVGKAYMEIKTTGNKANYFSIGGGNGTTGINNVNAKTADDGAYYTLQGVKVNKPAAKGIYIHNGKKVIK